MKERGSSPICRQCQTLKPCSARTLIAKTQQIGSKQRLTVKKKTATVQLSALCGSAFAWLRNRVISLAAGHGAESRSPCIFRFTRAGASSVRRHGHVGCSQIRCRGSLESYIFSRCAPLMHRLLLRHRQISRRIDCVDTSGCLSWLRLVMKVESIGSKM